MSAAAGRSWYLVELRNRSRDRFDNSVPCGEKESFADALPRVPARGPRRASLSLARRPPPSGTVVLLTEQQLRTLAERKRGWPWNGYELIQMKNAGKYPPARLLPAKPGR